MSFFKTIIDTSKIVINSLKNVGNAIIRRSKKNHEFIYKNITKPILNKLLEASRWLSKNVIKPLAKTFYNYILKPIGKLVWEASKLGVRGIKSIHNYITKPFLKALYNYILKPIGKLTWESLKLGVKGIKAIHNYITKPLLKALYNYILKPIGKLIWEGTKALYKYILKPAVKGVANALNWLADNFKNICYVTLGVIFWPITLGYLIHKCIKAKQQSQNENNVDNNEIVENSGEKIKLTEEKNDSKIDKNNNSAERIITFDYNRKKSDQKNINENTLKSRNSLTIKKSNKNTANNRLSVDF